MLVKWKSRVKSVQFEPSPHKTENALLTTAVVVPKAKTEADLRAVGNA